MFHKIKNVAPLPDYKLSIQFSEGVTKIYDMNPLFEKLPVFAVLKDSAEYTGVRVDVGGYGIVWNDDLDLSCDELWENGEATKTPFDGLIAFSDATQLWNLNESTLRKAISYGKLVNGVDVCKFGKQWVVSVDAMNREYGGRENRQAALPPRRIEMNEAVCAIQQLSEEAQKNGTSEMTLDEINAEICAVRGEA